MINIHTLILKLKDKYKWQTWKKYTHKLKHCGRAKAQRYNYDGQKCVWINTVGKTIKLLYDYIAL